MRAKLRWWLVDVVVGVIFLVQPGPNPSKAEEDEDQTVLVVGLDCCAENDANTCRTYHRNVIGKDLADVHLVCGRERDDVDVGMNALKVKRQRPWPTQKEVEDKEDTNERRD